MIAYVFPGQGSQFKGMGEGLFNAFPQLTTAAGSILGYDVADLCLNNPGNRLNQTQYTQPALYVVNALSYFDKIKQTGRRPDAAAGHSLGEYSALMAAGVFDFETGLKLVMKRGELMGGVTRGCMAAVIGLTIESLEALLSENNLHGVDIANYNTPSQFVISGLRRQVLSAEEFVKASGGIFMPLKVSGAFHSRYMEEVRARFRQHMERGTFLAPDFPVISNVNAKPHKPKSLVDTLAAHLCEPVQWIDSIRHLDRSPGMEIKEIGPGRVLTKLIAKIRQAYGTPPAEAGIKQGRVTGKTELASGNTTSGGAISPESLGDPSFKKDYRLKYAYLTGAMFRGIASRELVIKIGKAGLMGFLEPVAFRWIGWKRIFGTYKAHWAKPILLV
ncbi:MAG: ACP S-malonyltransferase [Desulfobacterales bacterium]|nr:ACP S-malonyltransferase [Desulfobacterales bacterium]